MLSNEKCDTCRSSQACSIDEFKVCEYRLEACDNECERGYDDDDDNYELCC